MSRERELQNESIYDNGYSMGYAAGKKDANKAACRWLKTHSEDNLLWLVNTACGHSFYVDGNSADKFCRYCGGQIK